MGTDDVIRLTGYSDKALIVNAYDIDPTIHKSTLAEQVIGCSYEYVRRLFRELSEGEIPTEEIDELRDEDVQRELTRRLLATGVDVQADLDVDLPAQNRRFVRTPIEGPDVVSAAAVAEVRDRMADTRELMAKMDEAAGEAVATMAVDKLDELLETPRQA
jgi:hypothetical protein